MTGAPKGFAFITYAEEINAIEAIKAMHDYEFQGRKLTVNQSSPRGSNNSDKRKEGTQMKSDANTQWKTVPTQSKNKAIKNSGNGNKGKGKNIKTWDQWTGPP